MTVTSDSKRKKTAQQLGAAKRKQTWKPGQSGNPDGAPKRGMSLKEAYEWALSINAEDMAAILAAGGSNDLSEAFRRMPKGFELKTLWAARILAAVMFEPQPGLINHVAERIEGKVKDIVEHSGEITTTVKQYVTVSPDEWDQGRIDVQPPSMADSAVEGQEPDPTADG